MKIIKLLPKFGVLLCFVGLVIIIFFSPLIGFIFLFLGAVLNLSTYKLFIENEKKKNTGWANYWGSKYFSVLVGIILCLFIICIMLLDK
jgi:hypothetical protein